MHISVFDLFTIGIGPSSSHTVGPMRAALAFVDDLQAAGMVDRVARLQAELYGSLGLTGRGHGTDKAIMLGFSGERPETVDPSLVAQNIEKINQQKQLVLYSHSIAFDPDVDLVFHRKQVLQGHANGIRIQAFDDKGELLASQIFFSIGGGFILREAELKQQHSSPQLEVPFPFDNAMQLMQHCQQQRLAVSSIMFANECALRDVAEVNSYLDRVWLAMQNCVERGLVTTGILPGGMKVKRRAPQIYKSLTERPEVTERPEATACPDASSADPLLAMDWVNVYAIAVNEENAAGGRVVTAPTNGAAGIMPAVLHYATRFHPRPENQQEYVRNFLLTAAAIASLYKKNASISGADVGCQGEVGVACSMAAGALAEYLGATPAQVENAAEIGMEHNLGLTCDPIGGLVQIPCIERNAMGSVKAINAARIALRGDGTHFVSLDKVIRTMLLTGRDMKAKYKETSRGGLAVNVVEC
jgi:L-serine dehydratase